MLDGAQSLGIVSGTYGGAAFLGSLAFGYVAHRLPRRITFVVCFVLAGGPSLVVPALGLGAVAARRVRGVRSRGRGAQPHPGRGRARADPRADAARVFGLLSAGSWAGIPLGGLFGGIAADGIGVTATFGVVAAVYTVVTLSPLLGGRGG